MAERLRVVVAGMVADNPYQGGAAWAVLQYVLGLQRLGHDVWLVEPVDDLVAGSAAYFRDVAAEFDIAERAAMVAPDTRKTVGVPYGEMRDAARGADLLMNVSGMLADEALIERIPVRVYLDLDPVFNQLWHTVEGIDMRFDGHTHFVTVGQAIGTPGCDVPTGGRDWMPSVPPVVLDEWGAQPADPAGWFTTVANWRGYGSVEYQGVFYGQKAHSLRDLVDLPRRTRERLLLALAIHQDEHRDLELLAQYGWRLVDPAEVAGTPATYRRFVQGSKGEFGLAKSGYALARSGWFSDRSACYLATGRPVVAQDTGFSRFLPTGEGLLSFNDTDGAAAGIDAVAGDLRRHARAARALAEEYLDSDRVLTRLLERVGAAS